MAESKTAVVAAPLGNAVLAALEAVAASATGSAAMLAETFHSIADTGNQARLSSWWRCGSSFGTVSPGTGRPSRGRSRTACARLSPA